MSKSPWGNIGNWAAEAERAEQEEREEEAAKAAAEALAASARASAPPRSGGRGGDSQNFPSLKDSVSTAKQQSKKKTKMSLHEFKTMSSGSTSQRLTTEEMLRLPTGPKERAPGDEMQYGSGRIGGGFSNYGTRSGGPGRIRDGDGDGSWGGGGQRRSYGGGFEDDRRRGPPMGSRGSGPEFDQTSSRADEVDNWATMKKSLPSFNSGGGTGPGGAGDRPSRYASLGGGSGGSSRADEVDNWATMKKPMPPPAARSSSFGSGFPDSRPPEAERWTRDGNQERQRLVLDLPAEGEVKVNKPNPFGAARPREEVLAEKGLDWKKLDTDMEAKKVVSSRPGSSQSSRPGSSQSARSESQQALPGEGAVKSRPKVNPFGDAKPREVLLQEKGLDWRKIDLDLEHRGVERPETEEEKNLKEEIKLLKNEMLQKSGEDQSILNDEIHKKEKDLEALVRDLDDRVRFGQKPSERPGSGGGRFAAGLPERPPSQHGAYEEPRGGDFRERPRSRGTGDAWSRPMDDRRAYQGGRGRGFLGNRDMDRSSSRERW